MSLQDNLAAAQALLTTTQEQFAADTAADQAVLDAAQAKLAADTATDQAAIDAATARVADAQAAIDAEAPKLALVDKLEADLASIVAIGDASTDSAFQSIKNSIEGFIAQIRALILGQ